MSRLFIPTLREDPAEAEAVSHRLLLRAGYVRQLAAGLYMLLPLGQRVMHKINAIMREEMDAIGAQEITLPVLHPAEIWQQTGRWYEIGDEMFRLRDRGGRDMCLGMTHEEIMTCLAAGEVRSYRDLPQTWYQIQTKMRDEARPKSGILRTREFHMKDSYSFDRDEAGLNRNYHLHAEAYRRIFTRSGLRYLMVESDPGMMGGGMSHEFMAPSAAGEDTVAICDECGYSANVELARSFPTEVENSDCAYEDIHTPEKRTLDELTGFLKKSPAAFMKCILVISERFGPVLALLRGDQHLRESKLQKICGPFRHATKDEVKEVLNIEAGFIGPMGHRVKIIADPCLRTGCYITGANRPHYHMQGVRAGVHFDADWLDIHEARAGDHCPSCGAPLRTENCIEIGNIFKLGTKYSEPLKAFFLDEDGKEKPIIMGSYGIGPARIMASAVEQGNDDNGIVWPEAIAPFDVHVLPLNINHPESWDVAGKIAAAIDDAGLDALVDDRDLRAGVKFKDADLMGIPWHVVVGERNLKEGLVEVKSRRTGEAVKVRPEEVLNTIRKA